MQSRREACSGLLIMTIMESGHPLDHLISAADRALRAMFAPAHASRPVPDAPRTPADAPHAAAPASVPVVTSPAQPRKLSEPDRRESAALMRVNHSGEV